MVKIKNKIKGSNRLTKTMDNVINKLITDYNIYSLMVARCSRILQTTSDNKVKEKIWRKWEYLRNKKDNIEKSIIEIIVKYD